MIARLTSIGKRPAQRFQVLLGSILMMLWCGSTVAVEISEAAIKAVYLYNFANFVKWPPKTTGAAFNICTLGDDEVTALLPSVIDGEKLGSTKLQHKPLTLSDPLDSCHIVYLTTMDDMSFAKVQETVSGYPILTVSDQAGFAIRGGHIEFGLLRKRVHLIINRRSVDISNLRVSAQLYRLATVID